MKRDRSSFYVVLILLALVLGVAISLMYVRDKVRFPVLHAMGGTWTAKDLSWSEYNGFWRVQTVAHLMQLNGTRIPYLEALNGLCGDILVNLPQAPNEVTRNNVYRVSLNLKIHLEGEEKAKLIFDTFLPIQIKDGNCQVKGDGHIYRPTYPGNLENWYLFSLHINELAGKSGKINVKFRQDDNSPDAVLPFIEACNAFFDDPPNLLFELLDKVDLPVDLKGVSVVIEDYTQYGPNILHFHASKFQTFQVLKGRCLLLKQGEDL